MSADALVYLDSSALVKLAAREAESDALRAHLSDRPRIASSILARVEVVRAVRRYGRTAVRSAVVVMRETAIVTLDDAILDTAAELGDDRLRTLDAIHVASALALGDELAELITYDRRMADAATAFGLAVVAPR